MKPGVLVGSTQCIILPVHVWSPQTPGEILAVSVAMCVGLPSQATCGHALVLPCSGLEALRRPRVDTLLSLLCSGLEAILRPRAQDWPTFGVSPPEAAVYSTERVTVIAIPCTRSVSVPLRLSACLCFCVKFHCMSKGNWGSPFFLCFKALYSFQ